MIIYLNDQTSSLYPFNSENIVGNGRALRILKRISVTRFFSGKRKGPENPHFYLDALRRYLYIKIGKKDPIKFSMFPLKD